MHGADFEYEYHNDRTCLDSKMKCTYDGINSFNNGVTNLAGAFYDSPLGTLGDIIAPGMCRAWNLSPDASFQEKCYAYTDAFCDALTLAQLLERALE